MLANLEQHQVQASRVFVLIGNVCSAGTSTLLDARNAIDAVGSGLRTALLSDELRRTHIANQDENCCRLNLIMLVEDDFEQKQEEEQEHSLEVR